MSGSWALRAAAAFALAGAAQAGIDSVSWTAVQIDALDLGADNAWTEGDDYAYGEYEVQMFENWVGGGSRNVIFDIGLGLVGERTVGTQISFQKSLTNNTGFFWSSFEIVLSPDANSTISGVMNSANSAFSMTNVMAGQNGSWILTWDQGAGTGVGQGESTSLGFSFTIDGNFGFMMKQTPVPAPAGAALLGVAGLAGVRRRRAA